MTDLHIQLETIFADITRRVEASLQRSVDGGADAAHIVIVRAWPDVGPDHPYATGHSKRDWRTQRLGRHQARVVNESRRGGGIYPGYADEGYTKAGKGKARPFQAKGGIPYVEQGLTQGAREIGESVRRPFDEEFRRG